MKQGHWRSRAFTLVELIVVIAVVAVLLTLTLAATKSAVNASRKAACVSHLHQIGVALLTYTQDHDSFLPGPLWRGQSPYYQTDSEGSENLADFLAPYLDLASPPAGHPLLAESFSCPAWRLVKNSSSKTICYYSTGTVVRDDGSTFAPFGHPGEDGDPNVEPTSLMNVPTPASVAALRKGVIESSFPW